MVSEVRSGRPGDEASCALIAPTGQRSSWCRPRIFGPSVLGEDPLGGSIFVFFSRRADRVGVLSWDRDGYVLFTKRLDRGTFRVPWRGESGRVVIGAAELLLVLEASSCRARCGVLDGSALSAPEPSAPSL